MQDDPASPLHPPISPEGLKKRCMLLFFVLVTPGLGRGGLQMGAFVEGSLLSLAVSSLSSYIINE